MVRPARAHLAGEALAGALPVVPWLLLQMRRSQLQRSRCAGAVGTGTPCGRDAGRRTHCDSLAATYETIAAAEVVVCWYVGHGHTLRKRRWQAHFLWLPGCC
jgi:hypothetical protein